MVRKKRTPPEPQSPIEVSFFILLQLCFAGLVIYWWFHSPAPGYAVTVLAFAAAAMSVNEKMGRWKKGTWLLLLALFAKVEVRAISVDRTAQDRHFEQTIDTVTGGDSFALISLKPLGDGGNLTLPFLVQVGNNPIHNLKIQIARLNVDGQPALLTLDLPPRDVAVGERTQLMEYPIKVTGHSVDFNIYFDALNGHWGQPISLRNVDGKWFESTKVLRADTNDELKQHILYEHADQGFPSPAR